MAMSGAGVLAEYLPMVTGILNLPSIDKPVEEDKDLP